VFASTALDVPKMFSLEKRVNPGFLSCGNPVQKTPVSALAETKNNSVESSNYPAFNSSSSLPVVGTPFESVENLPAF